MAENEDQNGKLKRKQFEKEMNRLQAELCKLQLESNTKDFKALMTIRFPCGEGILCRRNTSSLHSRNHN